MPVQRTPIQFAKSFLDKLTPNRNRNPSNAETNCTELFPAPDTSTLLDLPVLLSETSGVFPPVRDRPSELKTKEFLLAIALLFPQSLAIINVIAPQLSPL